MTDDSVAENRPVTFDKQGRMQYHPDYHSNHGKPWKITEQNYLVQNYDVLGPEQVSLALERTPHTVMAKAWELRKKGVMPPVPAKKKRHKREIKPNAEGLV